MDDLRSVEGLPVSLHGVEKDRWLLLPAILTVTALALFAVLVNLPGVFGFVLMFFGIELIPIAGVVLLAIAVFLAVTRRFRMATSILLSALAPSLWSGQLFGRRTTYTWHWRHGLALDALFRASCPTTLRSPIMTGRSD
jgi:hypothetical protein